MRERFKIAAGFGGVRKRVFCSKRHPTASAHPSEKQRIVAQFCVAGGGRGTGFQRSLAGIRTTSYSFSRFKRGHAVHIMFLKASLEILKELRFVICGGRSCPMPAHSSVTTPREAQIDDEFAFAWPRPSPNSSGGSMKSARPAGSASPVVNSSKRTSLHPRLSDSVRLGPRPRQSPRPSSQRLPEPTGG